MFGSVNWGKIGKSPFWLIDENQIRSSTYIASVGERLDHEQHLKGSVDGDGHENNLPMNES